MIDGRFYCWVAIGSSSAVGSVFLAVGIDIVINIRAIEKEEEGEDTQQVKDKQTEVRAEEAMHSDLNLESTEKLEIFGITRTYTSVVISTCS